jgi:hypothetical protein
MFLAQTPGPKESHSQLMICAGAARQLARYFELRDAADDKEGRAAAEFSVWIAAEILGLNEDHKSRQPTAAQCRAMQRKLGCTVAIGTDFWQPGLN